MKRSSPLRRSTPLSSAPKACASPAQQRVSPDVAVTMALSSRADVSSAGLLEIADQYDARARAVNSHDRKFYLRAAQNHRGAAAAVAIAEGLAAFVERIGS